jgi:MSHA biogenesis protein MshQ
VANAIGTQIAGKPSGTAPGAQTLQIRAIRSSDSSTVCEAALQGTQTVQMAYECVSPASCSAATLAVGATGIAGNPSGSVGGYSSATLSFDNAGLATFDLTWNDAGSARLHARYALPDASGAATGDFMAGSSNLFVSRPFAFELSVDGNPGASSATGAAFNPAGTPFAASARAVTWSAAADADADGIADGMEAADTSATNNADLSGNATTPNYAPSTALTLGSTLQFPAGGTHPGLTGSPSAVFTNGVGAISGLRYDEVGIIEITAAQGGSYLGIGSTETGKIRGSSGFVGRFRPARLAVAANVPLLASACSAGAFSYIGQPVYFGTAPVLSVTAQSALGTTTTNYTQSGFFKLDTALAGRSYADGSGAHPLGYTAAGSVTLAGSTAGSGTATLTLASDEAGDAITWIRANPEGPFAADVDAEFTADSLTDGDGACHDPDANGSCDSFTIRGIEGTQLRFGRLVAQSALGSEMQPLAVPLIAQYHDGSGFALNDADSCTVLGTAVLDFGVGGYANAPAAGVLSFPVGAGTSTASMPVMRLSGGRLELRLSAPGAGNVGDIDYLVDVGTLGSSWLQYDWDGNGSFTDNPRGRASFGVYAGPSRVVYRRESW